MSIKVFLHFFILSLLITVNLQASNFQEGPDLQTANSSAGSKGAAHKDAFNFLSTKFPHLLEAAAKPFKHCSAEEKHYIKLREIELQSSKSAEVILLEAAKDELEKMTLHYYGKEYEQNMLDQIKPMFVLLEQNHSKNGYFNTFFNRALTNHSLLEDILLAAEYIFQFVKNEGGGTVLFLGRTPCVIQVAYEEVLKVENEKEQASIHLNFSGHPDALTKRASSFYSSETNIIRDIVTPENLSHFFCYLDTKDILKVKKLFIADILASGGSLNSLLRILNAYYQDRQAQVPLFSFLNLTQDMNWAVDRSDYFTFEKTGLVTNQGILTLPEDKDKNIKFFQIPTCAIPIFDYTLKDVLDKDMFQEFMVHGVQYPAQKWTSEFDLQRKEGGQHHSSFYDYLRQNFASLIQGHQQIKS